MRVLIVFYSKTGNVAQLAEAIAEGARQVEGAEVVLRRVDDLAPREVIDQQEGWKRWHDQLTGKYQAPTVDELVAADAIIFGTPTRYGNVSAELKQFIDMTGALWAEGKLVNKVGSVFTSAATVHGGQELTTFTMLAPLIHHGMVIVTPGYADAAMFAAGAPYGATSTSGPNADQCPTEQDLAAARFQGRRVAEIATALQRGLTGPRITMLADQSEAVCHPSD